MIPHELPAHYLKPGELVLCDEATVVQTVLGSCVSVTLFHRRTAMGAICHGLLPSCRRENACTNLCSDGTRFMDCSIRRMIEDFRSRGIPHCELEAKVFGGADMFRAAQGGASKINVGAQNIRTAIAVLEEFGLHPLAADTGGNEGRKLYFISSTGEVYLKRVRRTPMADTI